MIVLLALLACGGAPAADVAEPTPAVSTSTAPTSLKRTDVDVAALAEAQKAGAVIVDVRTPEEFATGHVPGAKNIQLDNVHPENPFFAELGKQKPVYLICAVGGRSKVAADALAAGGFQANNVLGGTEAWDAAGYPLE